MSPQLANAFISGSGLQPSHLTFVVRLAVGGFAILCSVIILIGLMRLVESNNAYDKTMFLVNLFALLFILMLIFMYIA